MPRKHAEHKQHSFDSYCKKILKYAARNHFAKIQKRAERETLFSDMAAQDLAALSVTDEYFKDDYVFIVADGSVGVTDADLAEALGTLSANKRDILLMSFFFDMTDREIAERLNMARRTVAYQRTSSIQELKKLMESEE